MAIYTVISLWQSKNITTDFLSPVSSDVSFISVNNIQQMLTVLPCQQLTDQSTIKSHVSLCRPKKCTTFRRHDKIPVSGCRHNYIITYDLCWCLWRNPQMKLILRCDAQLLHDVAVWQRQYYTSMHTVHINTESQHATQCHINTTPSFIVQPGCTQMLEKLIGKCKALYTQKTSFITDCTRFLLTFRNDTITLHNNWLQTPQCCYFHCAKTVVSM